MGGMGLGEEGAEERALDRWREGGMRLGHARRGRLPLGRRG